MSQIQTVIYFFGLDIGTFGSGEATLNPDTRITISPVRQVSIGLSNSE